MQERKLFCGRCYFRSATIFAVLILMFIFNVNIAQALNLTVVGVDNSTSPPTQSAVSQYRWLLEEDVMQIVTPGQTCNNGDKSNCLAVDFHRSYMPVVAKGSAADPIPPLDPAKKYFISILPTSGYSMGGASISGSQQDVTINLNSQPTPTAQIRVFVFEDISPINNDVDNLAEGRENGLQGFTVLLEDAGGRTGAAGQQIITDVFGNPLGTTYDPNGDVADLASGDLTTDEQGNLLIKNLAPGKYGIQVIPPIGSNWSQTTTIEGSKTIDAWVAADEPDYFTEFGPPGPHVFVGFVKPFQDNNVLAGGATITGEIHAIHTSRPPEIGFFDGPEVPGCWVGLNDNPINGRGVFAAPCNDQSQFTIPNVPPGIYQLVIWDDNLDYIFGMVDVTVNANGGCNNQSNCNLGNVSVFPWFNRLEQYVFNDENENGIWDGGEDPMPEQATIIRWRDGTVYQSFPTDLGGAAPYDEVFPFFNWLVAEVDFARFKATGATMVVDDGGEIDSNDIWSFGGALNPQPQADNGNQPYRVETGPVLTQAYQGFLGQTNVIQWGKTSYSSGENGGISGLVYYATTRAEDNPRLAGAEPWEPGIPRMQLALYNDNFSGSSFNGTLEFGSDGIVDDINNDGEHTLSDVDNYPFESSTAPFPGPEDFDYNANGVFDAGDAVQITTTDSWDDNLPTGCQGDVFLLDDITPTDCFDGLRNFNQIRPGVFDGGYAFDSYIPGGVASANTEVSPLPVGTYVVGVGEHPVYETVKEEDRNVDFGDEFAIAGQLPIVAITQPECVGDTHTVADEYSLFVLLDDNGDPVPPADAGQIKKLCDRKSVRLNDGQNSVAEFFVFTPVPPAGHIVGTVLDDLANEYDENSPSFGEKYAPPYIPISLKDYTGKEIARTYSDQFGRYNLMVPSTYTNNLPSSSGMSPNMLITCMNDPGPIADSGGGLVQDPYFQATYSQFCYTLQYLPGVTTYLDTPVVPVAAFSGPNQEPLNCSEQTGKPIIWSVQSAQNVGPYVDNAATDSLTIVAVKDASGNDYGFGNTQGIVSIDGVAQTVQTWTNDTIKFLVSNEGNLEVTKANGMKSEKGIHVSIGGGATYVTPGGSIQAAINSASAGDLIIVPPGDYDELVVMWKPVRLQGSGASTVIRAGTFPTNKISDWEALTENLVANSEISFLPEQDNFSTEEGPGILVVGSNRGANRFSLTKSRIDGITVTSGSTGGGILVNSYVRDLEISNNRILNNYGIYGGGIRVGHPIFTRAFANARINIHHNYISKNGSTESEAVGGGISIYPGSDQYKITDNFICGNYTQGSGAGIGHLGNNGFSLIKNNTIIFNQSFNQEVTVSGGGIYLGGVPSFTELSPGTGRRVIIESNLIQGNQAGAGDGGGIAAAFVNGLDAVSNSFSKLNRIVIDNNIITNNMAAHAGGGISLLDTIRASVRNNTIVHNDSTATSGSSFVPGNPNKSNPQPAGIVSYAHSSRLRNAIQGNSNISAFRKNFDGRFSRPDIQNSIVWRNRSYFFEVDTTQTTGNFSLVENTPPYWDLGVLGGQATDRLNPSYSILTDVSGTAPSNIDGSNLSPDQLFISAYVNTGNGETIKKQEPKTSIDAVPAFDEGGNFIDVRFGPLQLTGDYHLNPASVAVDAGFNIPYVTTDFDGEKRFKGTGFDIGADETR